MGTYNLARWTMIVYGVLMFGGGVGGYKMAQSQPSLIAGIASAILMGASFVMSTKQPKAGMALALVTAIALVVVFIDRYLKTHKPMNLGLVLVSVIVGAIFAAAAARAGK